MRCLIVGGGGFLGSHLALGLLAQGHAVRILDRPNLHRFDGVQGSDSVEWYEGDFVNHDDVSRSLSGCDIVFHLAWTTLPKSSNDNPTYDVETNVVGTLHLLELACQEHVRKVIFVSSGGTVYGIPKEIPITESHATDPVCAYGISKLVIEKYLNLYHELHGLDYRILRLANPFGERQRPTGAQGAVSVFLHKALRNETIEIWGDGTIIRDYVYIGDVVDAFLKVASYNGGHRVLNIGSGEGKSLKDVIKAIESLLGRKVLYTLLPGRKFDVPVNILDSSRACTALGWQPKTSFDNGLSRMLNWTLETEGVAWKQCT
ncbi:MAG: NAD-dependent epimerase/dehydratase family protein [Nitrospiraceae bacterium]